MTVRSGAARGARTSSPDPPPPPPRNATTAAASAAASASATSFTGSRRPALPGRCPASARTASTTSSCVFGESFGMTCGRRATRSSITNIDLSAPQYFRPYICFSAQTPYSVADGVVLVGQQRKSSDCLSGELLDLALTVSGETPSTTAPRPPRSRRDGRGSRRPGSCTRACPPAGRSRVRRAARGSRRGGSPRRPGRAARTRARAALLRSCPRGYAGHEAVPSGVAVSALAGVSRDARRGRGCARRERHPAARSNPKEFARCEHSAAGPSGRR